MPKKKNKQNGDVKSMEAVLMGKKKEVEEIKLAVNTEM